MDKLISSRAKVIRTSSMAANVWGRSFDVADLNDEHGYSPTAAYGRSKLEKKPSPSTSPQRISIQAAGAFCTWGMISVARLVLPEVLAFARMTELYK